MTRAGANDGRDPARGEAEVGEREDALRDRMGELQREAGERAEVLAHVAHEIRSSLGAISMTVQWIRSHGGVVGEREISILERQTNQIAAMVDRLVGEGPTQTSASSSLAGRDDDRATDLASTQSTTHAPTIERRSGSASKPRLRIMVVDDHVNAAAVLCMALEDLGYETTSLHDGPSALQSFATFRPDVVLLDIGLPGIDGHEVARRLRGIPEFGSRPIIAVSGRAAPAAHKQTSASAFTRHLVKPVDLKELQAMLEAVSVDCA
jgi:CheY-like chemotaxis protein